MADSNDNTGFQNANDGSGELKESWEQSNTGEMLLSSLLLSFRLCAIIDFSISLTDGFFPHCRQPKPLWRRLANHLVPRSAGQRKAHRRWQIRPKVLSG